MTNDPKASPIGTMVPTLEAQMAFVPAALPRSLLVPESIYQQLDRATLAVGTLAGVGETLASPHLLIIPFLRREAVLSSRIEGTEASISDVFKFEAGGGSPESSDVREVVNYVRAVNHGLARLEKLPICTRLANEMHEMLLEDVRGRDKRPGELRQEQNWIGVPGTPIERARYVPPPHNLVPDLLADWERFTNEDSQIPVLIRCAMMHYQFEAIHPYLDGNGRIGRALIILYLCQLNVLPTPLLYMSAYFESKSEEYRDHLLRLSKTGEWAPWLDFFLTGVEEQARDALRRSRRIRELHKQYTTILQEGKASSNAFRLLDDVFINPYVTVPMAAKSLAVTYPGAQGVIARLESAGILKAEPGKWRPRLYLARDLLNVLEAANT